MKYLALMTAFLWPVYVTYAQNQTLETHEKIPEITIKERVSGKRKSLYLHNKGTVSYNVFFFLVSDNYTSNLKEGINVTIAPKSDLKVASLVLKNGHKEGTYKYTLKVNEVPYELDLKRDGKKFNPKINHDLKDKDIAISTVKDCDLCTDMKNLLRRNRIKFKEYHHEKDSIAIVELIRSYKAFNPNEEAFYAPMVKIEDSIYTDVKTPRDLMLVLTKHLK